MSAPAFTPGPWVRAGDDDLNTTLDIEGDDVEATGWVTYWNPERPEFAVVIADMGRPNVWNDELLDANANLIAAAPDMFEAIEMWLADFDDGRSFDYDHAARFRIVLAQARGDARGEQSS